MSEVKDPAIKLFGKTISLPPNEPALDHHHHEQPSCSTSQDDKNTSGGELTRSRPENDPISLSDEESIEPLTHSGACDTPRTPAADIEPSSPKVTTKEEPSETSASQEKTLKKPDKILPCPRCNSMDTKFCYYNNYNVNQPRHFCKKCQRYWTAGGTMRNVPIGSGRRKNKSSCASNYRHIMVSEALQAAQGDSGNGIHLSSLKADGTILAFGSERPLCESMVSALNLAEKAQNCAANVYHIAEQRIPVSYGAIEIGRDRSNGFCSTRLNLTEKGANSDPQDSVLKNFQGFPPQVPCFSGTPWPSQWNSAHWSSPATQHPFNSPCFPVSFYPASPYWGCTIPSPWNVTWLSPPLSSPNHSAPSTSPTSPTLGKHNRDGSMLKPSNLAKEEPVEERDAERSVLLPKTCRIDDPNEAAKSSISSTLEIKSNNKDSVNGASLFKAFHPTVDEKNYIADTSLILQANPAAFSRSVNFHEST